jgi:hypothetical protein
MRLWRLALRFAAAGALAATLAHPAWAVWPNVLPAQPLAQAQRVCMPGVMPINHRCHVVDFAKLGEFDGHEWWSGFYWNHWADRHGRRDRGFPMIFFLQPPATLRLSLWIDDAPGLAGRWAKTPAARPVLIQRPEGTFLGFTLKADSGPDDQRLFRLGEHQKWKGIDVDKRSPADQAVIDAATPADCHESGDWRYDWMAFELNSPLETETGAACGMLLAPLEIREGGLALRSARLVRQAIAPPKRAPGLDSESPSP